MRVRRSIWIEIFRKRYTNIFFKSRSIVNILSPKTNKTLKLKCEGIFRHAAPLHNFENTRQDASNLFIELVDSQIKGYYALCFKEEEGTFETGKNPNSDILSFMVVIRI